MSPKTRAEISPSELTREIVEEHRHWLLNNAGDANEVDACRQLFDQRLGARCRIEAKENICASINRRHHADAAKREAAQIEAAATGRPIDPTLSAAAIPKTIEREKTVKTVKTLNTLPGPRIGQRVRFTRDDHPDIPRGRGGMIDQLSPDDEQFFVVTDCGGFFGWTCFFSWEPTGEPDEVLDPEYVALRTLATPPSRRK